MPYTYEQYRESADFIAGRFGCIPESMPSVAVVLGSGLGGLTEGLEESSALDYGAIPYFPQATALSHAGRLFCGRLGGARVFVFSGRFHCYEGLEPEQAAYYVRVLKLLGVKALLLTNAAGCINTDFGQGSLMLMKDHICLSPVSPCRGANDERFGARFFDMTRAYSPALRQTAARCAERAGITLHEGVYAFMAGPQYETPAEIRALRLLGADAVGMSTVPEVIEAAHCGIEAMCVSCLSNLAAGITD
ncbi:MAG: purine-nucleoside phosphorylase, partial [Clostridia bacterium]|nr:purine-nucleoside phosphorylase [Clostridia bacterium]